MQEEAHPHALAATARADMIHAVVPVARAHQGQSMGAEARQRIVDRARAMAEQRILVARGQRHRRLAFPILGNGRRLEERLDAIEYGRVAGSVRVAQGDIGQPEMRVRGVGAIAKTCAAIRRPVPPFDRVALDELMRRMQ